MTIVRPLCQETPVPTLTPNRRARRQAARSAAKASAYGGIAVAAWLTGAVAMGHGVAAADSTGSTDSSASSSDGSNAAAGAASAHTGPRATGSLQARNRLRAQESSSAPSNRHRAAEVTSDGVQSSGTAGTATGSAPTSDSARSAATKPSTAVSVPKATIATIRIAPRTTAATPVAAIGSFGNSLQASATTAQPASAAALPANVIVFRPLEALNSFFVGLLDPFLKPPPKTPGPIVPIIWSVLGAVRRDLFNQAPTLAYDPSASVQTGQTLAGNFSASDPEGDSVRYTVIRGPHNGTLTVNAATGAFEYTPNDVNFNAAQPDSFTVSVTDQKANLLTLFGRPHADQGTVTVSLLSSATAGTVTVDFGDSQGALLHTERYNNFHVSTTFASQRDADVDFLNAQGLHGTLYRAWLNSPNQTEATCTGSTGACTLSPSMDAYLTDLENVSDSLLGNLRLDAWRGQDTDAAKAGMERILLAVKQSHPKMQLIEGWNEPDAPGSTLTAAEIYQGYKALYQAVNDVNATLGAGDPNYVPLKVGGPALYYFNQPMLNAFLDSYQSDPDPNKRLDFISYHAYLNILPNGSRQFYKADPSLVKDYRNQLDAMLAARGLDTSLPTYITETGIYPGPLCDACNSTDYIRQAAGMPSLQYWLAQQHDTYAFNWVARRQGLKDEFVTQNSVGPYANLQTQQILWQPYDPLPSNALTPYGNVMLMQSKMEDIKVAATSDQLVNGSGVYAVAAKDAVLPEASLMVWNYQGCSGVGSTSGCGTAAYDTTMKLANLPNGLGDGPVTVTVYRVDQNTSNFYYDPTNTDLTKAELKQVDVHTVTPEGGTLNFRTDLAPDTIYLFVLKGAVQPSANSAV